MTYKDSEKEIEISGDFPCGSAGQIEKSPDSETVVVQPKPEIVPDWFYDALQQNFDGAGVPREYAFHIRVSSGRAQSVCIRFVFTETNGAGYMDPPYWIRRDGDWWQVAGADTVFEPRQYAEITIRLAAGEEAQVANKPYPTPDRVYSEIDELARCHPILSSTVFGQTAEGRPLVSLETEPREETILVNATMQPAEPAARPVLSIVHWLTDRSDIANRLLEQFQFCFIPLPNPDGAFHGRSVTNARGEVPMFSFGRHLAGESAPEETVAFWDYATRIKPAGHIEFHTHYQNTRFHKLNPLSLDWFPESMHDRVRETYRCLLRTNSQWRVTDLAKDTPIVTAGKFVNLATHFQTIGCCYQIYALTEQSTCTQAIAATRALAEGLAGEEWVSAVSEPEIVKG